MIAADTSTWIALWKHEPGPDIGRLQKALDDCILVMPPPVLAELYSDPQLPAQLAADLEAIVCLALLPGYWQRAGELRARVIARGRKARLGDALIAQCCLDHGVALLTRDHDFRAFAAAADLAIVLD